MVDFLKNTSCENQYSANIEHIQKNGILSSDRTGTGTRKIQSTVIHCDLQKEFPILIGKKINFQNAYTELVWMLSGRNDIQWLRDRGVNYWDSWENAEGTIGKGYGTQFRNFGGKDQLADVIKELQENPDSRRAMISLWNPNDLGDTTLPPCHFIYHFTSYVENGTRKLDLHVTQRSADYFLGVPYNLCMSGIFLTLMSDFLGMQVGCIHQTFHDSHIYLNHPEQVGLYLQNVKFDDRDLFNHQTYELCPFGVSKDGVNKLTDKTISFVVTNPIDAPKLTDNQFFTNTWSSFDDMLGSIIECIDNNIETLSVPNYVSYPFIKGDVSK